MSLKSFLAGALTFLEGAAKTSGAPQGLAQNAQASVSKALADLEAAGDAMADDAVAAILAKVPGGAEIAPIVDDFLDKVATRLLAKKSTAVTA